MDVVAALPGDLAALRVLLDADGLPVADLDASPVDFLVARVDGRLVGAVGIERYGDAGLLRSLVVDRASRGTGLGGRLVSALESQAGRDGITRLVLLTQTAEPFFAARGYAVVERGSVPPAVQASAEFRSLCPASATCMSKTLEPG